MYRARKAKITILRQLEIFNQCLILKMYEYLVVATVTILAGIALRFLPPKRRNPIYGYRTRRSFHSQESWDFAQHYSGIMAIRLGIIALAIGGICYWLCASVWVSNVLGTLLLIAVIPITEERLRKRRFG
jgi:uncharacterized membrane protein